MDPNETLRIIRANIAQMEVESEFVQPAPGTSSSNFKQHALDLAEHVTALDEWLIMGGFKPKDWEDGRLAGKN